MSLQAFLEDIPRAYKMAAVVLTVAFALMGYLTTYHTDAEAADLWEQHFQAERCRDVLRLREEIREYLKQIQLDKQLDDADREYLREMIRDINRQIDRLDPEGRCG